jgi:hypothetical protein
MRAKGFDMDRYSDTELAAEFDTLFPQGFAGSDVLRELTPAGWEASELLAVCHPTLKQLHEEAIQLHRNTSYFLKKSHRTESPEPTLEEIAEDYRERPIETEREVRELIGQCLWDVFCENHEIVAPDGRVLDLGSFRAGAGFLAEILNRQIRAERYDYMDFYMGTIWIAQRADLTPVYRMIFRRLRNRGLDWVYHFPRMYAVDLRPLEQALDQKTEADWINYSPSEALEKEEAEKQHDKELAELRESFDESYRDAVEEALEHPPPTIVRAYIAVFGREPRGWPPEPC